MRYEVIIKTNLEDRPKDHELSAAFVLANNLQSDVIFLRPSANKTPDIDVNGTKWEIKSPKGNSKKTIENNLRTARKQSDNIVIDLQRSKMHLTRAISRINFYLRTDSHRIKHLKVLSKTGRVIDIL